MFFAVFICWNPSYASGSFQ